MQTFPISSPKIPVSWGQAAFPSSNLKQTNKQNPKTGYNIFLLQVSDLLAILRAAILALLL